MAPASEGAAGRLLTLNDFLAMRPSKAHASPVVLEMRRCFAAVRAHQERERRANGAQDQGARPSVLLATLDLAAIQRKAHRTPWPCQCKQEAESGQCGRTVVVAFN